MRQHIQSELHVITLASCALQRVCSVRWILGENSDEIPSSCVVGLTTQTGRNFQRAPLLSNAQTRSLCTNRTRPALVWARSRDHAKSNAIIVFPPPRGYIVSVPAGGRTNTRGMDRDGLREFERSVRPRVAHGVRMSGAPRRSRSQHPVLEATTPPALVHRGYPPALCLGLLSRFRFSLPSA